MSRVKPTMLRRISLFRVFIALNALGAVALASAQDLSGLLQRSPFGSTATGQAATAEGPLEFRSVLVDQGEMFFSIYQPSAQTGLWVALNEPGNPFTVRSYDDKTETVTVEFQGRTMALALKQAKIHAFVQKNPVMPQGVAPTPGAPPSTAPANAADEAGRLARVAEEVRRRRALRQQPGVPPSPNQFPNQPPNLQQPPNRPGTKIP